MLKKTHLHHGAKTEGAQMRHKSEINHQEDGFYSTF